MKNKDKEAMKTRRHHPGGDNVETRYFNIEHRAEGDAESRTVEGVAAVFDVESGSGGWFIEKIAPGAFDNADMSDVRALLNHDPNKILARTKNKSLTLEVTDTGLNYRFDCPNTTTGNDCLDDIQSGRIDQSSFAFTVRKQSWVEEKRGEDWVEIRVIEEIEKVYDVSPVTYPFYEDTTVAKRSYDAMKLAKEKQDKNTTDENVKIEADARARRLRLLAIR